MDVVVLKFPFQFASQSLTLSKPNSWLFIQDPNSNKYTDQTDKKINWITTQLDNEPQEMN